MKINNGNEKIDFSNKIAKELTKSDLQADKANSTNETIFKKYDKNNDGKLTTDELASILNEIDANSDGTVTDQEITDAVNKIENVKAEKKTEYVNFIKNMAAKNAEKIKDDANVGNSYVIQLGEQLDDLIARIMKSQGEKDEDCVAGKEKFEAYKKQFLADNPDAYKKDENGNYKYLIAAQKVYIRTNSKSDDDKFKEVKDLNNEADVVNDYKDWIANGKKSFTYKVGHGYSSSSAETVADLSTTDTVDFSKFTDEDYGKFKDKKDDIKEKVKKSLELINKLKDTSNCSIPAKDKNGRVKVTFTDGTKGYVLLQMDKDNNITDIWVDIDGENGSDGKPHSDIAFYKDGTLKVNMDNDAKTDLTMKKDGAFNFDDINNVASQALSSADESDETDSADEEKQDPSKVNGTKDEQAETLGLRRTDDKAANWYYSDTEKCHFRWNGKHFERIEGISRVNPGGTFYTTINNKKLNMVPADNAKKGYYYCQTDGFYYTYENGKFKKQTDNVLVKETNNDWGNKDKVYASGNTQYTLSATGSNYSASYNGKTVVSNCKTEQDAIKKMKTWISERNNLVNNLKSGFKVTMMKQKFGDNFRYYYSTTVNNKEYVSTFAYGNEDKAAMNQIKTSLKNNIKNGIAKDITNYQISDDAANIKLNIQTGQVEVDDNYKPIKKK